MCRKHGLEVVHSRTACLSTPFWVLAVPNTAQHDTPTKHVARLQPLAQQSHAAHHNSSGVAILTTKLCTPCTVFVSPSREAVLWYRGRTPDMSPADQSFCRVQNTRQKKRIAPQKGSQAQDMSAQTNLHDSHLTQRQGTDSIHRQAGSRHPFAA